MQTLKNLGCQVDERFVSVTLRAIIQDKVKFKHCDAWHMYELSKGKQYQALPVLSTLTSHKHK